MGLRYCGWGICGATPVLVTLLSAAFVVLPITVLPDEISGSKASKSAMALREELLASGKKDGGAKLRLQ